jgi:hypothetical protein
MPLKSAGHRNTGIGPEEVDEEPIATARVQEQQRRATVKAQRKSDVSIFLVPYCSVVARCKR